MALRFFDTNVLIYSHSECGTKSDIANTLLAEGGVLSVQVCNEFASMARRKLKRSWPEITAALDDIRVICGPPKPLTLSTHTNALALAAENGFAFHDALIIAAALEAGCTTLVSEDMQHGQIVRDKLRIHNPFRPD